MNIKKITALLTGVMLSASMLTSAAAGALTVKDSVLSTDGYNMVIPTELADENGITVVEIPEDFVPEYPTLPEGCLEKIIAIADSATGEDFISDEENEEFSYGDRNDHIKMIKSLMTASEFEAMDKKADEIVAMIDPSWDTVTKILFLNDYLCMNAAYDFTYSKYSAYNILVEGEGVCNAYSHAMWWLLDKIGVNNRVIISWIINHAWNIVEIDGKWYLLDTTWNDQEIFGYVGHPYFLKSESQFGHKENDKGVAANDWSFEYEGKTSAFGIATDTRFDNYFWKDINKQMLIYGGKCYYAGKNGIYRATADNKVDLLVDLTSFEWKEKVTNGYISYGKGLSSLVLDGSRLYYNSPDSIYAYDINTGKSGLIYTVTAEEAAEGMICGLFLNGNTLTYRITKDPYYSYNLESATYHDHELDLSHVHSGSLTPPAGIEASASAGDGCVTVSWGAVPGCTEYKVYYREKGGSWNNISAKSSPATVTGLKNRFTYEFTVVGCNGIWGDPADSAVVSATPNGPLKFIDGGKLNSTTSWNVDGNGILVISGTGATPDLSTSSSPWEAYKSNITTVIFEEGITSVGTYFIVNNNKVTSITLPSTLTYIDRGAFWCNTALKSIIIPEGVEFIDEMAFYYCSSLTHISLPYSLVLVGEDVFKNCALNHVHIDSRRQYTDYAGITCLPTDPGCYYTNSSCPNGKSCPVYYKAVNRAAVSQFVERLYTKILGRASEEAGKADWVNKIMGGQSATSVAAGFIFSQELTNRSLNNRELVSIFYNTFLDRAPDEAGLNDWTSKLDNGCSVDLIFYGFSQSTEFNNICESYGINRGTYTLSQSRDISPNLTAFTSRMYTKALGRQYEVGGLNDWTGRYIRGEITLNAMAQGFIFSEEFLNKNMSDEQYVETLYATFFDRPSDAGGKSDWLNRMHYLGYSREDVLNGFLGAEEFGNLVKSFGL